MTPSEISALIFGIILGSAFVCLMLHWLGRPI